MGRKRKHYQDLKIDSLEFNGHGVGRNDGKVFFVKDALPGEVVDVRVTRRKKQYNFAAVEDYKQLSDLRIEPFCEHFDHCGGCKWQNIDYPTQLHYKQQFVQEALVRIGKLDIPEVNPIIGCDETRYYRNKMEFSFSNKSWLTPEQLNSGEVFEDRNALGFHVPGMFDKVIDINHCYLQGGLSNDIRLGLRQFTGQQGISYYDIRNKTGMLRNLTIRNTTLGQTLVLVAFGEDEPEVIEQVMVYLNDTFPDITSLNYVVNTSGNDAIYNLEVVNYNGTPYIEEKLGELTFRIGPKSFFQTNSRQANSLYDVAMNLAALTGTERVYDLYTGIGTIALYMAGQSKEVIGIESVPEAIDDAHINADINNISNCRFLVGDMRKVFNRDFIEQHGAADVVITDPPRAGMHPKVVETLLHSGVPRIVYISCNPTTQARDLQLLTEKYAIKAVQPVDMFPQTYHIENVVLLELK